MADVVCAWCGTVLEVDKPGLAHTSHGLCAECEKKYFEDGEPLESNPAWSDLFEVEIEHKKTGEVKTLSVMAGSDFQARAIARERLLESPKHRYVWRVVDEGENPEEEAPPYRYRSGSRWGYDCGRCDDFYTGKPCELCNTCQNCCTCSEGFQGAD